MPVSVQELVELGRDFHRQLSAFSREDRLVVAAAMLTATMCEYPKATRSQECNRALDAVLSVERPGGTP